MRARCVCDLMCSPAREWRLVDDVVRWVGLAKVAVRQGSVGKREPHKYALVGAYQVGRFYKTGK